MCRLTPVILATQEAETRRITISGQPGQKFFEISYKPIKAEHWKNKYSYGPGCETPYLKHN
jgi:hypothetical protein